MGLFDKKYCDICGEKIGLLGNRKLDDGNLCKDCASKLSPWFSERRQSTVADIQEQLAYREANKAKVAAFNRTRSMGNSTWVMLDEDAQLFMVSDAKDIQAANPDVLAFTDVTGVDLDVEDRRWEEKRKNSKGEQVSYNPPRWHTEYDYWVKIHVTNPYFDVIRFKINRSSVDENDLTGRQNCEREAMEIRDVLMAARSDAREQIAAAAAPQAVVVCALCGATTTPDATGACEYCGGPVNG